MIPAHPAEPPQPHDLWTSWALDPGVVAALLVAVCLYGVGRRRARAQRGRRRATYFWVGLLTVAIALVSPLDAAASALASAHMVQHLLLTLVAAPLLALSRPGATLLRGTPRGVRRTVGRWRGRLRLTPRRTARLGHPVLLWLAYVATPWFWHASVTYDAALASDPVHGASHVTYLLTGVMFWRLLVRSAGEGEPSPGLGLLLTFGAAMQAVFLSALLTFAAEPWYAGYAGTTTPWGLDQLTDQQLAGAIMWLPGGLVYVGTALALFLAWLREGGPDEVEPGQGGALGAAATAATAGHPRL